ncbi:MAG: enoyl-CoA hydratase-related protein [Acidimicrobiia bacterium]|nr:enoyl-CoA hydratase-related protein [Acidimicrobiia bacterium]
MADGVATITIADPEQGNALTGEMRDHLAGLFDRASASLHVRAVRLTGAGPKRFLHRHEPPGPRAKRTPTGHPTRRHPPPATSPE